MRAFLTGGTGFVGANLVRLLLQQGYEVRALVRPNSRLDNLAALDVEIVRGDLNSLAYPSKCRAVRYYFTSPPSILFGKVIAPRCIVIM